MVKDPRRYFCLGRTPLIISPLSGDTGSRSSTSSSRDILFPYLYEENILLAALAASMLKKLFGFLAAAAAFPAESPLFSSSLSPSGR